MILYRGKIYDTSANDTLLASLRDDVDDTLLCKTVDREKLIGAIDTIASGIAGGKYDALIAEFDIDGLDAHVARAAQLLKAENTATLLKAQLPALYGQPGVKRYLMPAGVLFHIAAGNADVLPAYSVLTGLICGNVNVLKLPSQDNGITIKILSELISVMPELSDFIYAFDTSTGVCPSLHAAYSIGILSVGLKDKTMPVICKVLLTFFVIMICLSVCFVKQHSAVDVLAALPVCLLAECLVYGRDCWRRRLFS